MYNLWILFCGFAGSWFVGRMKLNIVTGSNTTLPEAFWSSGNEVFRGSLNPRKKNSTYVIAYVLPIFLIQRPNIEKFLCHREICLLVLRCVVYWCFMIYMTNIDPSNQNLKKKSQPPPINGVVKNVKSVFRKLALA